MIKICSKVFPFVYFQLLSCVAMAVMFTCNAARGDTQTMEAGGAWDVSDASL